MKEKGDESGRHRFLSELLDSFMTIKTEEHIIIIYFHLPSCSYVRSFACLLARLVFVVICVPIVFVVSERKTTTDDRQDNHNGLKILIASFKNRSIFIRIIYIGNSFWLCEM